MGAINRAILRLGGGAKKAASFARRIKPKSNSPWGKTYKLIHKNSNSFTGKLLSKNKNRLFRSKIKGIRRVQ